MIFLLMLLALLMYYIDTFPHMRAVVRYFPTCGMTAKCIKLPSQRLYTIPLSMIGENDLIKAEPPIITECKNYELEMLKERLRIAREEAMANKEAAQQDNDIPEPKSKVATSPKFVRNIKPKALNLGQIPHSNHAGVTWHKTAQKWQGQLMIKGIQCHLGRYVAEDDAARAVERVRKIKRDIEAAAGLIEDEEARRKYVRERVAELLGRAVKKVKTSNYPGVWWHKNAQKWQGQLPINGTSCYLGLYDVEDDAARTVERVRMVKGDIEAAASSIEDEDERRTYVMERVMQVLQTPLTGG